MKLETKKNLVILIVAALLIVALLLWNKQDRPASKTAELNEKPAPDFILSDINDNQISLSTLKGKNILLFFNEGLGCYPACWDEMIALGKDKRFQENDTAVFSIVTNNQESWQQAMNENPDLKQVNVLFDTDAKISKNYGMLNMQSSMHKGSSPGHTYVLIDKTGIMKFILDDIKMGKNADKLIDQIKKINS